MNKENQDGLYSKKIIAELLNLSERRVEQLTKDRIIPKAGRGVYDLAKTVNAYVRYLQGVCAGRIKTVEEDADADLYRRMYEARVLEREAKARQAKYRADGLERELLNNDLREEIRGIPKRVLEVVELRDPENRRCVKEAVDNVVDEILNGCDSL